MQFDNQLGKPGVRDPQLYLLPSPRHPQPSFRAEVIGSFYTVEERASDGVVWDRSWCC